MGERRLPSDALTRYEDQVLEMFWDRRYHTVVALCDRLNIPPMTRGNFGATVRRLYEKGRLSFRYPEGDYCIVANHTKVAG